MTNNLDTMFNEAGDPKDFARGYLEYLGKLLRKLDVSEIAGFIDIIRQAQEEQRRIFFIGNGGSAATASHFANDLSIGVRNWNKPIRAIALTDNVAVITAVANDYGYDDIFLFQLKAQAVKGDVLVAISASGNSKNLIRAVEYGNSFSMTTISLTGFDGGQLKNLTQNNVHVDSEFGEYGPVEDLHMVLDHLVGAYLMLQNRGEL